MSAPLPPMGFMTDVQRRRVQALVAVVMLMPSASCMHQMRVARWLISGTWDES
jgi:hypothetical protein